MELTDKQGPRGEGEKREAGEGRGRGDGGDGGEETGGKGRRAEGGEGQKEEGRNEEGGEEGKGERRWEDGREKETWKGAGRGSERPKTRVWEEKGLKEKQRREEGRKRQRGRRKGRGGEAHAMWRPGRRVNPQRLNLKEAKGSEGRLRSRSGAEARFPGRKARAYSGGLWHNVGDRTHWKNQTPRVQPCFFK